MNNADTAAQLRDDEGRYAVGFDAMCVCGHSKGEHAAGPKGRSNGDCLHNDFAGGTEPCNCLKFRKARR